MAMSLAPWKVGVEESLTDRLQWMAGELARQAAHIAAAEYRWLVLLGEFDELGGWGEAGARSCADWLSFACGIAPGTAREHVRVAKALRTLPEVSASFAAGRLSYSKVRAITRVATPVNEELLVIYAECATAAQLETVIRGYRTTSRAKAARDAQALFERRYLRWFKDGDGMINLRARLTPEDGAIVIAMLIRLADSGGQDDPAAPAGMRASLADAEAGRGDAPVWLPHWDASTPAEARQADALRIMAESVAATGPVAAVNGETHLVVVTGAFDELRAAPTQPHVPAGTCAACGARSDTDVPAGTPTPAEPPRQVLRSDDPRIDRALFGDPVGSQTALALDPPPPDPLTSVGTQIDGIGTISPETARRIACDATIAVLVEDAMGRPVGISRQSVKVPRRLRRLLLRRAHGTCQFPACTNTRFLDAHHIVFWADGGTTDPANLIILCRFHHRLVHEAGYRILATAGGHTFQRPDGTPIPTVAPIREGDPDAVERANTDAGIVIDQYTGIPDWDGTPPDYSEAIRVLAHVSAETPAA